MKKISGYKRNFRYQSSLKEHKKDQAGMFNRKSIGREMVLKVSIDSHFGCL